MINAVILAGAPNKGALKDISSEDYEALIPVLKRPMFLYVLETLLSVPQIQDIVIVGPKELDPPEGWPKGVRRVDMAHTLVDNLAVGVKSLDGTTPVLIVTSDIPLLSQDGVDDFLKASLESQTQISYPIIPKPDMEAYFPGSKRTYFKLLEGKFTGGNILLIQPHVVGQCQELMVKVAGLRKKPWLLSRLLGFSFLIKFAFGRLSIDHILKQVERISGLTVSVVVSPWVGIGYDVDKPEHHKTIEIALNQKKIPG